MSDDERLLPRWLIEPEPTAAEFVALFSAMRSTSESEPQTGDQPESRWARTARREQFRTPLDGTGNGWNR